MNNYTKYIDRKCGVVVYGSTSALHDVVTLNHICVIMPAYMIYFTGADSPTSGRIDRPVCLYCTTHLKFCG